MLPTIAAMFATALVAAGAIMPPATVQDDTTSDAELLYNLNLVGMERAMPVPGADDGHRIFVPLWGECRINLSEGEFGVEDGNCTDDGTSAFTLPNPDPEDDGVSAYRVYVRALGKPGGSAVFNTCFEDEDGRTWCSTETVVVARAAGESPQMDVSKEALTVCHDQDGDGTYDREQIFDDSNKDYFWSYNNSGLRLAQLRFVNEATDISGPCPAA